MSGTTAPQPKPARGMPRVPGSASLVGRFDAIDQGVEACGWLFDLASPDRICTVELRIDGRTVAQVPARHPRPDLAATRIRPDSGFRIAIPGDCFDGALHVVEALALPERLRIGPPRPLTGIRRDPAGAPRSFSVDSILALRDGRIDYDRVFPADFLERHGVRAAVAYGYLWLLRRPPDSAGWTLYAERILAGALSLGDFLRALAASEEGKRAQRGGIDLQVEFAAVLAAAARLPGEGGQAAPTPRPSR